jgi:hypothetical protein
MGLMRSAIEKGLPCLLVCFVLLLSNALAQEKSDLTGWEKDSAYSKFYNVSEFDDFKGVVEEVIDITPLPGMAPGVGLKVKDQDKEMVEVHLGPKSFVKVDGLAVKKGDKVKIKGVWAAISGKDVFLASKVKKGEDIEIKMRRTKDGVPFWTLSPEELAKEKQE